ncbi:GntR family transcriptional regulator [Enterococcus timonensis]|uniref:GntR family transcriptional regulator n=1 Tax=Enterococcus timonensis TaxID=1852364 RepID=UPI0008D90C02|nr:LacI family DNA-binding transcriptional regulator [Enterococcus timonensis]
MIPLYKKIMGDLEADILSGKRPVATQVPTEKELSQQYQVSRITSKRALNELETLGLIERVQGRGSFVKAPEKIFSPAKKILFILPFANDLSLGNFNLGLEPVLQEQGYTLLLGTYDLLEQQNIEKMTHEFAGLIYYPDQTQTHLALLFALQNISFPVVILDKEIHELNLPTIVSDNFSGGFLACQALLDAGHEKIAYLFGSQKHGQTARNRYLGYLSALTHRKNFFQTGIDWYVEPENLLSTLRNEQITGLVCENDLLAMRISQQLKNEGARLPEDFSVVGFDDIQASRYLDPPLTTIQQDFSRLGETAGETLLEIIHQGHPLALKKIPVSLVVRQSIALQK